METNVFDIKYKSKSNWITIVPMGDLHLGNLNADLEYFKRLVKWIANKDNCYTILLGDMVDSINPSDPRYDHSMIDHKFPTVDVQTNEIKKILKPLADKGKIIGIHEGNHENSSQRYNYFNPTLDMCKDFKVPFLGYTALTKLRFERTTSTGTRGHHASLIIYSNHGQGGGISMGAKANKLRQYAGYVDADIYLMAHHHVLMAFRDVQLTLSPQNKLVERKRVYACTGCFQRSIGKGKTSFLERKGFPPSKVGVVKIMIHPDTKDIHVSQ